MRFLPSRAYAIGATFHVGTLRAILGQLLGFFDDDNDLAPGSEAACRRAAQTRTRAAGNRIIGQVAFVLLVGN